MAQSAGFASRSLSEGWAQSAGFKKDKRQKSQDKSKIKKKSHKS